MQQRVALLLLLLLPAVASAHPVPLAQATVQIDTKARTYEVRFDCDITTFIMGTEPGHLGDELAGQLEVMTDVELMREVERKKEWFASQFEAGIDGTVIEPDEIAFPAPADIRDVTEARGGGFETHHSRVTIRGSFARGAASLSLRFPRELGGVLLIARRDGTDLRPHLMNPGQPSPPLSLTTPTDPATTPDQPADPQPAAATRPSDAAAPSAVAGEFIRLGFEHIIPAGPDHILFVLGLFLLSPKLKPLLWQVTAFTLAHSVTLALAMNGVVNLPAHIVEPLIAASIAFVAIENIFTTKLQPWRPVVVFAFGLLHGLGFAGVMSELDLPQGQFVPALVGFNIGVELGQLAVIALALLAVGWFRNSRQYRWRVVIPASLVIAAIGIYWTIERVLPWFPIDRS